MSVAGAGFGAKAGTAAGVQRLAEGHRDGTKLASLKSDVRSKQKTMSAHKPPATAAQAAQAAAKPPQDDKQAQGKAANAEKMNAAKPGGFDKAAFVKAVNDAIAAQAPKNLDEADEFSGSGKADAVKGQVQGRVADGKKQSAGQIETTTKAPPDTSAAKEKPVTPLQPGQPAATPATPDPANAVPDKAPASATDFSAGPRQVDQEMADAQVTDEQLAKSNEPEFAGALKDKKAGEQHAATAPAQVRGKEEQTLAAAKSHAVQQGGAAMQTMASANKGATAAVSQGQQGAQGSDETKRAQVTGILQKVFDATQKDVEQILDGLDKKVDDAFSAGEKKVRDAFTADHKRRMDAYKDKRYSGLMGKGRWIKDKFAGLPEEANQIFVVARQGYVAGMQQVISDVADLIGGELTRAKQRIATGRDQLKAEVAKLPADLQAIGKKTAGEFSDKFDELTESVDSKGKELVDALASKYNDALKSVDAEIEAEKEKNKGLIAKAMDAVGGVIKTILQLKDLLLGILAKAAAAVMAILKDPIGFLSHLVSALGAGLGNFMNNIGAHLQKGLIGWLLGTMSGAGLQLPAKFDLRGILGMIASLLGLTWNAIRGRIMRKGIPEQAMSAVEAGVPLIGKLQNEGVAGVTEEIKEQVGDLKSNLLGKISKYLIPTVLVAGITWIISLLNPASAFVKAVKMIIDIVTFIIDRGAQIVEFVNSVLDAIIAIAGGGAGGVPALIEKALAASIPVLIGALAAILGIGGIADKIKGFFTALSKPVMKAVDWLVAKIVKLGKQIWAKLKSKSGKGKDGKEADPFDVRVVARQAAQRGWAVARQRTDTQLVGRAELESALAKAGAARGGVQVQVVVAEAGTHWTVRATAGKGAKKATAEEGKGWIAKGENGASWYAAKDHSAFNRSVIAETFDALRATAEPEDGDLRTAYAGKVAAAKNITVTQQGRLDGRARGLKLTIGMEPFTGVARDKQIATTVKIAPNTTQQQGQVPAAGDAFPYRIGPLQGAAQLKTTAAGTVNEQLQPFPAGGFEVKDDFTGFAVNLLATPDKAKSDLATRYLDRAWAGDPELQSVAANRTAVIAGVNAFEGLDAEATDTARSEVASAVSGVAKRGSMLMAVFGFLWEPRWFPKAGGGAVPLSRVRKAYAALTDEGDRAKAKEEESTMRQSKSLPYGALREQVLRSTYTRQAVEILSTRNHRVHVVSQDPDGGLTTVGEDPMGVLAKYTKVLADMQRHPMLTIGGYSFKGVSWAADADPRRVQLTVLGNEIDRAIRAAVAKVLPRMIYPTEPNMLIKAWTHDKGEQPGIFQDPAMVGSEKPLWGKKAAEGWAMRDRLARGYHGDEKDFVAYVPEAATTTDPLIHDSSRGFGIGDPEVLHAARPSRRNPDPADALLEQSQTYANAKRLAMEMAKSETPASGAAPADWVTQGQTAKVYSEVESVVRMLARNPKALSTEELRLRLEAIDAKVEQVLARRKRGREDLIRMAGEVTKEIVRALTSADLVETWAHIKQHLDQIVEPAEG
ncbi:phage tail protein [Streptomyces sp. NPDC002623]